MNQTRHQLRNNHQPLNRPSFLRRGFRLVWRLGLLAVVLLQMYYLTGVVLLTFINPSSTAFMRLGSLVATQKAPAIRWVAYQDISTDMKRAVIASEDANFMTHHGFEIDAIQKALERNLRQGKIVRGGSTITQQLAKNIFLSHQRSYIRKLQELIIAIMMESILSKQRILEIYLNVVEFGVGIYGIHAASMHYYGVLPNALTTAQAAQLASALPAPKCFDDKRYCTDVSINFPQKVRKIRQGLKLVQIP